MNRFNRHPTKEYSEFKKTVQAYADADHEPGEDVNRALADALSDDLREGFCRYWGVKEESDGRACIRRVITGETECTCSDTRSWVDREKETIGDSDDPPHSAPHEDHAELWLSEDGDPVLYSMHVSSLEVSSVSKTAAGEGSQLWNGWFDVLEFAQRWGLELGVTPWSHYHTFSRVNVVFYSPEWARERSK
jgi:hypothetical protein